MERRWRDNAERQRAYRGRKGRQSGEPASAEPPSELPADVLALVERALRGDEQAAVLLMARFEAAQDARERKPAVVSHAAKPGQSTQAVQVQAAVLAGRAVSPGPRPPADAYRIPQRPTGIMPSLASLTKAAPTADEADREPFEDPA